MAHVVTVTPIVDGPKKATFFVYLESDGQSGELVNYVLIDTKTDFAQSSDMKRLAVLQVWNSFSWFDGLLKFDDLNPMPSWQLTRDASSYHDLRYFGGLKDITSIDGTGKLMISTSGFSAAGSVGTMVIEVRKD